MRSIVEKSVKKRTKKGEKEIVDPFSLKPMEVKCCSSFFFLDSSIQILVVVRIVSGTTSIRTSSESQIWSITLIWGSSKDTYHV